MKVIPDVVRTKLDIYVFIDNTITMTVETNHRNVIFGFWQSKKKKKKRKHAQTTERRSTYTTTKLTSLLYVVLSSCENNKFEDTKGAIRSRKSIIQLPKKIGK